MFFPHGMSIAYNEPNDIKQSKSSISVYIDAAVMIWLTDTVLLVPTVPCRAFVRLFLA